MDAVKAGGDRQELHERIRTHSMEAAKTVKEEGKPNDLLHRIAQDPAFNISEEEIKKIIKPENFTGRAEQQTIDFISDIVQPILDENSNDIGVQTEINV